MARKKKKGHRFNTEEAREAGKRAHELGKAHEFTPEEARKAGRKGGKS